MGLGTFRAQGKEATAAVATALRQGLRLIDTASIYKNEAAVREALEGSGLHRSEVWITSKASNATARQCSRAGEPSSGRPPRTVLLNMLNSLLAAISEVRLHLHAAGAASPHDCCAGAPYVPPDTCVPQVSPYEQGSEAARAAVLGVLERLGLEALDLALIHFPGVARTPPGSPLNATLRLESWRALEELYKEVAGRAGQGWGDAGLGRAGRVAWAAHREAHSSATLPAVTPWVCVSCGAPSGPRALHRRVQL